MMDRFYDLPFDRGNAHSYLPLMDGDKFNHPRRSRSYTTADYRAFKKRVAKRRKKKGYR